MKLLPPLLLGWLCVAGSAGAQALSPGPETPFVRVTINGELNLRAAPSTDAGRVTSFVDGTMLRRLVCGSFENRTWCEVETLGGEIAGWAAADFLVAHLGADPAALTTPAVAADRVADPDAGRLTGKLGAAEIADFRLTAAAGEILTISSTKVPPGTVVIVFGPSGEAIGELAGGEQTGSIEFGETADVVVRLVEMAGRGGDYALDLRID